MDKITVQQFNSLVYEIKTVLMQGYDSDGETFGMGDIDNCHNTADAIVLTWMNKNNIEPID